MDEKNKLTVLIHHWIEHNEGHMAEYRKWAEKARELGLGLVTNDIEEAIKNLLECNHSLQEALKGL